MIISRYRERLRFGVVFTAERIRAGGGRVQVQYYSMVNVYHAYTGDLHLRALYFDRTADVEWPAGFFRAPGALEYFLNQSAPYVVSMRVSAEWTVSSVARGDSQSSGADTWAQREADLCRHRFFHVRCPPCSSVGREAQPRCAFPALSLTLYCQRTGIVTPDRRRSKTSRERQTLRIWPLNACVCVDESLC